MTPEEQVYAEALDTVGSEVDEPETISSWLHRLHDACDRPEKED